MIAHLRLDEYISNLFLRVVCFRELEKGLQELIVVCECILGSKLWHKNSLEILVASSKSNLLCPA